MDSVITYSVRFYILLFLSIPSVLISLIIFGHFATDRNARKKEHNHSILLLLIVNFFQVTTSLPMPMHFFRLEGVVVPATPAYCIWWAWNEFSFNLISVFLMAWISVERHLLIFHNDSLRNLSSSKRTIVHIVPLVVSTSWGPIFYIFAIIISPMCTTSRNYTSLFCGLPCFLGTGWGTFEMFVGIILPVLTIFVSNLALFLRVIHQRWMIRDRVQQNWRRQRKMAFQLGLISFVYLIVWLPLMIAQLGQIYFSSKFFNPQSEIFSFLVYIVPIAIPMVCLMSMPDLLRKIKNLQFRGHCSIGPVDVHNPPQKAIMKPPQFQIIKNH